jgi:hypothetical protein
MIEKLAPKELITFREITSTSKKIMEVFRYFKIKRDEILSTKLILSKRELWQDVTDKHFTYAIEELIEMGYIAKISTPAGWRLLERGAEYLNQVVI